LAGIPYTGSKVLASALGMDKIMFRKIMEREKILVPKHFVFKKGDVKTKIIKKIGLPLVVKPSNQGSSVGVSLVFKYQQLDSALKLAFSFSHEILIEEYLEGTEVQCGILGNEKPEALPVIEIVPKSDFFDYDAKYQPGLCEEIVPARISKPMTKKVQNIAVKVFQAIGCRGFGRVDLIISKERPYVLEINTIPGLTPTSLLPQEAAAAGISYSQLLDRIIELALQK
jgi:D-alanine-D-alanine ligase